MTFIDTHVSTKPLRIESAISSVTDSAHGAINTFIGTVRDSHNGKNVTGITYDVHPSLVNKIFYDICNEAQQTWKNTRYYVSHFHGNLKVGDISVLIAVSAPHRAESFEACRYIIEEIKKRAPIWKKEHYINGKSEWLPGHSLNRKL